MKVENPIQTAYDAVLRIRTYLSRTKPNVESALNAALSAATALETVLVQDPLPDNNKIAKTLPGKGREAANRIPDPVLMEEAVVIAERHGFNLRGIQGRNVERHIVTARVEIATVLRRQGASYVAIGAVLKRDHSTIIGLLRRKDYRCACVTSA